MSKEERSKRARTRTLHLSHWLQAISRTLCSICTSGTRAQGSSDQTMARARARQSHNKCAHAITIGAALSLSRPRG